eukprot:TRINITY_DN8152_c0_g1_i1.p1 TRINITY_DN8152_c0_g1~~TRINITY_DN8152_c0_g1_i1.p1  ORF type:complete len:378 (-),score=2.50 TRINITY_DN8152_c0_g1_i1:166-1299(-)
MTCVYLQIRLGTPSKTHGCRYIQRSCCGCEPQLSIFSRQEQKILQQNLNRSQMRIVTRNAEQLLNKLHAQKSVKQVVQKCPSLLGTDLFSMMTFLEEFGVEDNCIKQILEECPDFFTCTVYQVGQNIKFFLNELLMTDKCVIYVLRRQPLAFVKNLEGGHQEVLDALTTFGLTVDQVRFLISCNPKVLQQNLPQTVLEFEQFFIANGFSPQQIRTLMQRNPLILGMSIKSINQKVQFLRKRVGLSEKDYVNVALNCSDIMTIPLDVSSRKLLFLEQEMNGGLQEIIVFPKFFSSEISLFQRIGPRVCCLYKYGISFPRTTECSSQFLDLAQVLENTDKVFLQWISRKFCVSVSLDDYDVIKYEWQITQGPQWHGKVS